MSPLHRPEGTGENDPVLSQFAYTYDVANQLTSYTGPEGTLDYEYDHTGQLLSVSGARSESYSFDVNGNRTMSGYETAAGNRLTTDGAYDYTYDNEGNMVSKTRISDGQVTEYTWDYRNRLTRIVVKDAQENVVKEAQYTYDVFDRRIGVWEDADGAGSGAATQRWTAYDGPNPWADFDENGSLTNRYLYGPGIDELWARIGNGEVDWYLTDYLGSVRQVVASDATVLDDIDYDSFGQIVTETHPENGDRFKYTGREYDAVFEQYYYRDRYYGADIGRFSSEDPLGFAAGDPNWYRYVGNSPTNLIDPTGLWGLGWIATADIEGGFIFSGGLTGFFGMGIFGGGPNGGWGPGFIRGGGAFATAGGLGKMCPKPPKGAIQGATAIGGYAGFGFGPFITNATSPADLKGPMTNFNLNAGVIISASLTVSIDPDSGIWMTSLTFGPGVGASLSWTPTYTWTTP